MMRLRFLGSTDVLGADGAPIAAVMTQPKRLALLAFLAAHSPHRFHRRDSLLAIFWPELSQPRARSALRRALFVLRRALGPDAILSRGDEVGTNPAVLWCDVTAFLEEIEAGRLADAVALHRGHLLEGLHVPSAPEFERWLDEERGRLRDAAARSAWTLAERADAAGSSDEAARWAGQALDLMPDDEAGLRRLIELLDRAGARTAAIRAYEGFAERLAADFGLDPAPETVDLIGSVRASRPVPSAKETVSRRPPSPNLIAVLPFTIRGPHALQYLREGMVDLLAAKLDGAGELRTVDQRRMLRYADAMGLRDFAIDDARAAGAQFHAGWCLLGSIVATGHRLHIAVTLCQTTGDREIKADVGTYGEGEIFKAVDEIARHILAQWSTSHGGLLARLAAVTTESLPALKAYLVGEQAFRSGRFTEAIASYESAVRTDPTFALGHYRLAATLTARGASVSAQEPAARAWRHRERLNARVRLLVEAQRAALEGNATSAEGLCRSITRQVPTNVEAWVLLAETHFNYNPARGRSVLEAREAFERALRLDPKHVGALAHLVRLAALERRTDELEQLLGRFETERPDAEQAQAARIVGAFTLDRPDTRAQAIEAVGSDPSALALAVVDVAVFARDVAGAEQLAEQIVTVGSSPSARAHGHTLLGYLALAANDPGRCLAALERAARDDRAAGLLHRGLVLAQDHVDAPTSTVEECLAQVDAWTPPRADAGVHPTLGTAELVVLRHYVLGHLHRRIGVLDATEAHAEQCAVAAPTSSLGIDLAAGLRAHVCMHEGDAAGALRELESLVGQYPLELALTSPFLLHVPERFLRGVALDALGRPEEAVGWLESLAQRSPFEFLLVQPAAALARSIRESRRSLQGAKRMP